MEILRHQNQNLTDQTSELEAELQVYQERNEESTRPQMNEFSKSQQQILETKVKLEKMAVSKLKEEFS